MIRHIFLVVTILSYVTPVFIRSGLNYNQNKGQTQGADFYDLNGQKIGGHVQESEGHNIAGREKKVDSQDSSRYGEQSGAKSAHANQNQYDQSDYHQDGGRQEHEIKKNVGHKKGHHKSGFHNSYYKDESGNNSSYHEDDGDEGSQYTYDGRNKNYDGMGSQMQRGHNYDNRYYDQDKSKHQLYDNRDNTYNDRGGKGYYNQRHYYDDAEKYGKVTSMTGMIEGMLIIRRDITTALAILTHMIHIIIRDTLIVKGSRLHP
ncbi:hypothetical protein WA026_015547 [Henosepilachna vigintioctopunctata]|uniref:Uncharacterized protein n=1 Tax=Henosepilachna vigintioctopunctata TaxID=420089 RepID=A0AAW1VH68_9CUCU